jgi:alkylated DNA repair dioxygenase AlkB
MTEKYPIKVKEPFIVKNILPPEELKRFQQHAMMLWATKPNYDNSFGRHQWHGDPVVNEFHEKLTEVAREYFESPTLMPSWALMSTYEGEAAKLWKHKDDNACTYHIDLCVFQKTPWGIFAEDKEYILEENDGLFMYGNDQEHWREAFPNPETNLVCNAFFFFCEPDHWYFTEGPEYLYTHIRAQNKENKM